VRCKIWFKVLNRHAWHPFFGLGTLLKNDKIIASVRQWLESLIVGMSLCPFAKRELVKNRVRFIVTEASQLKIN